MLYEKNHSLLPHNTFGIECIADAYGEYGSVDELRTLLSRHAGDRILHIGQGSNLLFLNDRFHGLVLRNGIRNVEVQERTHDTALVKAGGGTVWDEFVRRTLAEGYYGLENLSLIPGEVGAAAVQNIGAYGVEVGEFVESVECVELATQRQCVFHVSECKYGYRSSRFKTPPERGCWAVIGVTFRLKMAFDVVLDYKELREQIERKGIDRNELTPQQLRDVVVALRQNKLPDPAVRGNAGSFFKNPTVSRERFGQLLSEHPDIPHYDTGRDMVKLSAAWLIDKCGWKGRSLGRTAVHGRHALVIINLGGARGSDVLALSEAVCSDVSKRFGITLEPEVNFIS